MIWWGTIMVGASAVAAGMFGLRAPVTGTVRTIVLAVGGALVGLGAIGLQPDASAAEWVLTPLVLGALSVLHARLLFAGEGPGRI
ncbi:MAG: hypothetical protein M3P10_11115 [Actinomycetota bacterium]|nr:hypothetical protein [Actinomycetota bacterium]